MAVSRIIISNIDFDEFVKYCGENKIKAVLDKEMYFPQIIDFGSYRSALIFFNHFADKSIKNKLRLILPEQVFYNLKKQGVQKMDNISPSERK